MSLVVGVSGLNGHSILKTWAITRDAIAYVRHVKAMLCPSRTNFVFRRGLGLIEADVIIRIRLRGHPGRSPFVGKLMAP